MIRASIAAFLLTASAAVAQPLSAIPWLSQEYANQGSLPPQAQAEKEWEGDPEEFYDNCFHEPVKYAAYCDPVYQPVDIAAQYAFTALYISYTKQLPTYWVGNGDTDGWAATAQPVSDADKNEACRDMNVKFGNGKDVLFSHTYRACFAQGSVELDFEHSLTEVDGEPAGGGCAVTVVETSISDGPYYLTKALACPDAANKAIQIKTGPLS